MFVIQWHHGRAAARNSRIFKFARQSFGRSPRFPETEPLCFTRFDVDNFSDYVVALPIGMSSNILLQNIEKALLTKLQPADENNTQND